MMNELLLLGYKMTQKHIPLLPRLIYRFNRIVFACDIPPKTKIGIGTLFSHSGLGVVVNGDAVIGKNCRILQNVTIGGRGEHGTPVIEDNVTIGASACIIGGVTVGHDSVIGAHAVVLKDVPPYSVVVGNPARVIKQVNGTNVINNGDEKNIIS